MVPTCGAFLLAVVVASASGATLALHDARHTVGLKRALGMEVLPSSIASVGEVRCTAQSNVHRFESVHLQACRLALNVMSAALTAPIAGARVPTLSLSVTCSHGAPGIVLFVAATMAHMAGAYLPRDRSVTSCPKAFHSMPASSKVMGGVCSWRSHARRWGAPSC